MSTQTTKEPTRAIEPVVEKGSVGGLTILTARREPVVVCTDDPRITRALLSEAYDRPDPADRWRLLSWKVWIMAVMGVGGLAGLLWLVLFR